MTKIHLSRHGTTVEESLEVSEVTYAGEKGWFLIKLRSEGVEADAAISTTVDRKTLRKIMRKMKEVDEAAP